MRILVTGGAGYIGSVAVELLLRGGYEVTILDDFSTGHTDIVPKDSHLIKGSLLERGDIARALVDCDAVMHFAGKSLVGESVERPNLYWSVNVDGTRNLLEEMRLAKVSKIVFSSSAATYGQPDDIPIQETCLAIPTNPYGATKLAVDEMLSHEVAEFGVAASSLRYFNVAGAVKGRKGWLRERHNPETHLIPNVLRASSVNPVQVFGTDWPTPDGTCIRDYVHVKDLIAAHVKALNALIHGRHMIFNLGSGRGYSVREVVRAAGIALGKEIPTLNSSRRAGDPATLIADISKVRDELGWQPALGIDAMVTDALEALR